jgi:hypothetical protein
MRSMFLCMASLLFLSVIGAVAQEPPKPYVDPALLSRATKVSGFDSDRVTRHFYVLKNGGAVEITAKDPNDEATIKAIQAHLKKESDQLTKGNFEIAANIYGRTPESAPQLKKLRDDVTYATVPQENGGVLRMLTVNPTAKSAIHDYLRFQIDQLKTGDPTTPQD